MIATVVGAPVAIAVAALGYGAWALIALEVTIATVSTVLLWVLSPWRPSFTFSWTSLRELGRFGGNALGARFLADMAAISDKLLIGRFLGAAALGAYTVSYNTVLSPFTRIVAPLQEVLFPAFSRIQNEPERMAAAWLRASRVIAAIACPCLLGLIVVAPDFVPVVLGHKWHRAIPVIQLLAWAGLLQAMQGLGPSVLQARNRPDTLFKFTMVSFAGVAAAVAIGLPWGLNAVAIAYAALNTVLTPVFVRITARALGASAMSFLTNILGIVVAAAAMAGCVEIARRMLLDTSLPTWARLVFLIGVGALVYVPLLAWRTGDVVSDIRTLGRRASPTIEPNAL
jgi:O-antigen/teichoic acid export membrane protein